MIAKHIKADGTTVEVTPKNGKAFKLEELQALVGGYIEMYLLNTKQWIIMNEDGLRLALQHNNEATALFGRNVVGDVLIAPKGWIK